MISKEYLQKFKELYKKRFNKDLTDQEALEGATKLLRLIEIIYKPMTKAEAERLKH
jgi:hypothetical protein